MPVSLHQVDRRICPACQAEVVSDIWLIVHRSERPSLWKRAASLHMLTCPNGHRGPVRAPLLLFDPACPFLIFVPPADARAEGDRLMRLFLESVDPCEMPTDLRVEVLPHNLLSEFLSSPSINLNAIAPGAEPTDEALALVEQIQAGQDSAARLRAWSTEAELPTPLVSAARYHLAKALSGKAHSVEEAVGEWRQVLRSYPRTANPQRWAIACSELAQCLAERKLDNRLHNLKEALTLLDEALEILTFDSFTEDYGIAQSRRANLLLDIDASAPAIDASLAAYQAALSVYSRWSYPYDWALICNNMATAHLHRDSAKYDDVAIATRLLRGSLEVRTLEAMPREWAYTQMNLGMALARVADMEDLESAGPVLASLIGAVEVFSELGDESGLAGASFNLGIALARTGEPTFADEAIARLEPALPGFLETAAEGQAADALRCMAKAYLTRLKSELDPVRAFAIADSALIFFQPYRGSDGAVMTDAEVGLWLMAHHQGDPDRLIMAENAFERTLADVTQPHLSELRAAALGNLAVVLLIGDDKFRRGGRDRARSLITEALGILEALPPTPERNAQIGRLVANLTIGDLPLGETRPR